MDLLNCWVNYLPVFWLSTVYHRYMQSCNVSPEKTIHDCKQCQLRQKYTKLSTTYTIKEGTC